MDVSTLNLSNAVNSNIGINVMKKAQKVQEQQMQGVMQSLEQNGAKEQANTLASKSTGVGITLNTLA